MTLQLASDRYADDVRTDEPSAHSYAQLCGIATALDVVGDRWAILVIRDLLLGPLRFGDLAGGLPGIGTNTLAARLKQLEAAGVVRRRPLPRPDRGTVYELTGYGRELEPILMALGRWGTRSMGRLPAQVASRSRWLVAAILAFHDESRQVSRPTTWELRLDDGPFTVHAEANALAVEAGAPAAADSIITVGDQALHLLLTSQLESAAALASGAAVVDGESAALERLISLCAFPATSPAGAS